MVSIESLDRRVDGRQIPTPAILVDVRLTIVKSQAGSPVPIANRQSPLDIARHKFARGDLEQPKGVERSTIENRRSKIPLPSHTVSSLLSRLRRRHARRTEIAACPSARLLTMQRAARVRTAPYESVSFCTPICRAKRMCVARRSPVPTVPARS